MKENPIKLSQIITQKQIRDRKHGSMHALNNSFKRNALLACESATKYQSSYECKLPEVNFSRRDLSIILRYLLFKQEMQPSDRNLLRRILLGIFQQQLISAGSKNFVNYLKLVQGANICHVDQEEKQFYFVLKGNGIVKSGQFSYYVKPGDTFGLVQIFSNEKIQKIQFSSNFLLLKLEERYFNQYYRNYYEKIYNEKQTQLSCIKQNFLEKIPLMSKYLFLNKIQYKTFLPGQKIVIEGEPLKKLYFISNNGVVSNLSNKCIGLSQLLKQRQVVRQTVYCNKKTAIPYINIQKFTQYVLNNCSNSFLMNQSSIFDKFKMNNTRSSFEAPEAVRNFMKVKIVKLKMNRSRLKTEMSDFCQTSFKFFKPNQNRTFLNPEKAIKDSRLLTRSRYQRTNYAAFPKPLKNNYF